MDRERGTHGTEERYAQRFGRENHFEDLGVNVKIILKRFFLKYRGEGGLYPPGSG